MSEQQQPIQRSLRELFGLSVPETITMPVLPDSNNPFIPKSDSAYVFTKDVVRDIRAFLMAPGSDALYITGPTGSGKTSGVLQMAARLNWPVQQVTAHGRMELSDLIGHHTLVSTAPGQAPVMQFVYGPLPTAMKNGHILLINEIDLVDPAELSGLNDVLDGRPLVISQNGGEIVVPHPMFRVIATGNSAGGGDATGLYQGVQMQNLAAMDRYRFMHVGYPSADVEKSIIKQAVPSIPEAVAERMVAIANRVRDLFMGSATDNGELTVTMSTRTLVRWAKLTVMYRGAESAVLMALESALLLRAPSSEAEAIRRLTLDMLGTGA